MAKPFDSIIDAFLADREPDWKDLGLADAKKSGEEQQARTHGHVDTEFMDDIAESASKHTPIWGPKSGTKVLENRLAEKEKAAPSIGAVTANWHKDAYRRSEDYKSNVGDNESLLNEVTESIEAAASSANFGENNVKKREISDGQVQKYVRDLLNQGETPAKVAQKLEKLADLELFNHQMATDYLQRNAGMMGLAYLEPNTFMDKDNPNYRHDKTGSLDSKDCVRSAEAMKKSGITPRAKSVKQVKACGGCSYFKRDASGKRCDLYHLPVVANVEELSQIVNNLTPGVPQKHKHAALVQIANRLDEHVQPFDAGKTVQTNIVKTADAKVSNQAQRKQARVATFTSSHLAKLHEKGVSLADAYKWADVKFGSVETSVAFRGFVNTLKKNDGGKIVVAASDLKFLNSIGIRNEKFESSAKCASCPKHFSRDTRPEENERGILRVDGKFAQRTASAVAGQQKEVEVSITAKDVRLMHQKGHSLERIYAVAAKKVGSVEAKKVVAQYLADLKKVPGRIQVNASDRGFLVRVGFKPEALRTIESVRPVVDKVVVTSPKFANSTNVPKDGHAILNEYDLSGAAKQDDIDINGPERLDVESSNTFKVDLA